MARGIAAALLVGFGVVFGGVAQASPSDSSSHLAPASSARPAHECGGEDC
jgi:hypothetical protein